MTLARQFISADISEQFPSCWRLSIKYSYYGLYTFIETFMFSSLANAKNKLILERCGDRIRIVNKDNVNIILFDESTTVSSGTPISFGTSVSSNYSVPVPSSTPVHSSVHTPVGTPVQPITLVQFERENRFDSNVSKTSDTNTN